MANSRFGPRVRSALRGLDLQSEHGQIQAWPKSDRGTISPHIAAACTLAGDIDSTFVNLHSDPTIMPR